MTSSNIQRDSAVWNMAGSILLAFQSVIMLIVISHVTDETTAGIFTMGNVSANLFLFIGKYGVRGFQVSDVKNKYSFKDYHYGRYISVIMMILISVIYTLYTANRVGYSSIKTQIIIWMCMMRVPEAYEDVFYGDYQKKGRLDIGSKCLTIRLIATVVLYVILIIVTKDVLLSTIISTVFTFLLMIVLILMTREMLSEGAGRGEFDARNMFRMLIATTPIFAATFLSNYIGVAPKNAIDRIMDDTSQAIYGYVSMPVFVVMLLASVVFNPVLLKISFIWSDRKFGEFVKQVIIQVFVIVGISVTCLVGAYLLGVPVLSFLYNTDLAPYKTDLMLIVTASGMLAFATLFMNVLTVMRKQAVIISGYFIVAVLATVFSDKAVKDGGIRGAVIFYLILLILLSVFYTIMFIVSMAGEKKKACFDNMK